MMKKFIYNLNALSGLREFSWVIGCSFLLTIAILLSTDTLSFQHPDFIKNWDHHKYIQMAQTPFNFYIAPFCWRILVPLTASIMPFSFNLNFLIISFLGVVATGVSIYYLIKIVGFSHEYGLIGLIVFFSFGWASKFVLYDFWLPDSIGFFLITLIIYNIYKGREWFLSFLLVFGVLVKESVIFVIPLYYTINTSKFFNSKLFLKTIILALPPIATLLAVRILIPSMNHDLLYVNSLTPNLRTIHNSYDYITLFKNIGFQRFNDLSLLTLKSYTVNTFGVIGLLLPFFSIKKNINLFVKYFPFIFLVYFQLLFASNTERLIIAAFPVVIIMAMNGFKMMHKITGVNIIYIIILPIIFYLMEMIFKSRFFPPFEIQALVFILYFAFILQFSERLNFLLKK